MKVSDNRHLRVASAIEEIKEAKSLMRTRFYLLGSQPKRYVEMEDWLDSLTSWVSGQRFDLSRTGPGSWCMAENDIGMDKMERVDYIWPPSYFAVGTMIQARAKLPDMISLIPGFENSIRKGLMFASTTKLSGYSCDEPVTCTDAVDRLYPARVFHFIKQEPEFCTSFLNMLEEVKYE